MEDVIAGAYTLTFVADSACVDLPSELRTRTYGATITPLRTGVPANTSYSIAVDGASFASVRTSFSIGVAGDYVGLLMSDPALVEVVAPNTYLAIDGSAGASVTSGASTITAPFDGVVDYCVRRSAMGTYYSCSPGEATAHATCGSKNHRLILTRR